MALKVQDVQEAFQRDAQHRTIKMLVAGAPGVGKTRTAASWPNVLYADAEGGLLSVRDRKVRRVEIDSVAKLDELRAALAQEPSVRAKLLGAPVDTVVLDTVDEISKMVQNERKKAEKIETLRMQDWGFVGDTLRSMLRGFRNLDLNVILNVHVKTESDGDTGRVWERPDVQGAVGNEIPAYVDLAVVMVSTSTVDPKTGEQVSERYFQTFHDSTRQWVKDRSGTLPPRFPINFVDDYRRLSELIFGPLPTPDAPVTSPVASVSMSTSTSGSGGGAVPTQPSMVDESGKARTTVEDPSPEPEARAESVPTAGTEPDLLDGLGEDAEEPAAAAVAVCADCGEEIPNPDQVEISLRRWEVPLCRADFAKRKTRRR